MQHEEDEKGFSNQECSEKNKEEHKGKKVIKEKKGRSSGPALFVSCSYFQVLPARSLSHGW
ncbi:MAG TPA: hypothetical protein DDX85_00440 [Nitrospiraceae bacterium]|nr:hypothetical protein [Nitrospiraceae bacterium]